MAGFLEEILRMDEMSWELAQESSPGKMKNPPADGGGYGQARRTRRLPYISRRRLRAADIGVSLPPIANFVNASRDKEVAELPAIGQIETVGIVGETGKQVVARRQRIPVGGR